MFDGLFFFTYIIAAFVGCIAILLVVLLAKYWSSGNKKLLAAIRNFMICTAAIDALYFYMEYHFLTTDTPVTAVWIRVADIFFFIGQMYFWTAYIREKGQFETTVSLKMQKSAFFVCIICIVLTFICYGILMDDYYYVQPGTSRTIAVTIEIIICILLTSVMVWHLAKGLSELVQKIIRKLVTCITVLIIVNSIWNAILVLMLMSGKLSPQMESAVDPTPIMIFLINLLTIILVYREDFSAMFQPPKKGAETGSRDFIMNTVAQEHGLTLREREVMELAYDGMTNPEIAEQLTISKYTVKRHMHNLFEKLDVSTRMELIHLINQKNGPDGPL